MDLDGEGDLVTGRFETTAEVQAGLGLSAALLEASVTAAVDVGQRGEGLGDVDGAVFTVAVVEGVSGADGTIKEGVDGRVEGPSAVNVVVVTIRNRSVIINGSVNSFDSSVNIIRQVRNVESAIIFGYNSRAG